MELIGERWSVLILRDMVLGETRFNSLARGLPGLSRTLLAKRLRQLEADGLVEKVGGEYLLTPAGEGLQPVIMGLGAWGARFAFDDEPRPDELEASSSCGGCTPGSTSPCCPTGGSSCTCLPRRPQAVLDRGRRGRPLGLHERPGFEVDLTVDADLKAMYQVWLGRQDMASALRSGDVAVHGSRAMVRLVPSLFLLSPAAPFSQGLAESR